MRNSLKRKKAFISLGLSAMMIASTIPQEINANTVSSTTNNTAIESSSSRTTMRTISFDLNGWNGQTMSSKSVPHGSHANLSTVGTPTNTSYFTFAGWYKDKACTIPFPDNTVVTSNMTAYAKWNGPLVGDRTHEITMNMDGGSLYYNDERIYNTVYETHYNASVDLITGFEMIKYKNVFRGWYQDAALTIPFPVGAKLYADMNVYAKWVSTHLLHFNTNGGSSIRSLNVVQGELVENPPANPTKAGHTFGGWYYDTTFTRPVDFKTHLVDGTITVFAKWIPDSHQVTFNLNGGTGDFPTQEVEPNGTITAPTTEPTKSGNVFMGWYTDAGLTTPVDFNAPITANTTLYAKWATAYTLSYDLKGGEGNFPTETYPQGANPVEPEEIPTKEGFDFAGWHVDGNLTIPMDFDTWEMEHSGTVFAKWVIASHDVAFNLNGGEGDFPTQTITHNGTVTAPTVEPTKEWHTFDGWYTDAALTNPVDFTTPITADTTLYAKWTAQTTYTLGFELNGGEGDFPTQRIVAGGHPIEPDTEPTRAGYNFVGWYKNSALTSPMNFETWEMNHNGNVFAKWERITHEISFNLNGGEGEFPAQTVNQGENVIAPVNEPTKEGYRFVGWYVDGNLTTPFDFEGFSVMQDGTIFAKWEPLPTYTVNFNLNHGLGDFPVQTIFEGGHVVEPTNVPTKENYAFVGWYADTALTTEFDFENTEINTNTTIYAKWIRTYTLGFNLNGGEGDFPTQTIISGGNPVEPTAIPTKEGYDFVGWYMDGNLTTLMDFDTYEIAKDGNVFAKWERRTHEISFDLNGGEGDFPTQTINEGEHITAPSVDPTREGYRFAGWYTDGALTRPANFEEFVVMRDGTVFAKWTAIPTYTLGFNLNGGEGDFPTQTIYEGEHPTRPEAIPTKEGYDFVGWYVDGNLTTEMDFETWEMEHSGNVFAKWAPKNYTISYNLNGGQGDFPEESIAHGNTPVAPDTNPTRAGYSFVGWYLDSALTLPMDFDTWTMSGNITLFAKWTPVNTRYTLRFNLNGGSGSFPAQSILTGSNPIAPTVEPTKAGYTFGGWYLDEEFTTPIDFNNYPMQANTTVFAKWID